MEEKKRTKAEYRSSLRSKRLIREALVTMMRQKPFEKITITDIVKTADINRGTFYAHYKDTEEVLASIKEIAGEEFASAFEGMTPDIVLANPRPLFSSLTGLILKDRDYYKLILSVDVFRGAVMQSRFRIVRYLMSSTSFQHLASEPEMKPRLSAGLDFLVTGIINLYADVISGDVPIPLEELPDLLTRIAGGIVRQLADPVR